VQAQGHIWLQPGSADLVWATLTYPNGFTAQIHLCWNNPDKQRRLCLVGTQGSLIFDEMSAEAPLILQHGYLEKQGEKFVPAGQFREVLAVEKAEPLKEVCDAFLVAVQLQQPCLPASGETATKLVQILQSLSLSLKCEGKVIAIN
jgi:predicted dehydrogenase